MAVAVPDYADANDGFAESRSKSGFEQPAIGKQNDNIEQPGNHNGSGRQAEFCSFDATPAHKGPSIDDNEYAKEEQRVQHEGDEAIAQSRHAVGVEILRICVLFAGWCVLTQHPRLFEQMLSGRNGPPTSGAPLRGGVGFPMAAWT